MRLNFEQLRLARQDALTLMEMRTKRLRQLEERGASYKQIMQAREDLEEAKEIVRHANKLFFGANNQKGNY